MEQINILVVDDEKEIADLVEIYLVSDGYKVFKANNAKEGLEILDKEEIHLVLLDITSLYNHGISQNTGGKGKSSSGTGYGAVFGIWGI